MAVRPTGLARTIQRTINDLFPNAPLASLLLYLSHGPDASTVASDAVRTCRDPLAVGTHCVLWLGAAQAESPKPKVPSPAARGAPELMIWETVRSLTPVWVLRASLILLLQTWAFGRIHTLESGRATSSRERRSAATPSQASTIAAIPIRAAPKR